MQACAAQLAAIHPKLSSSTPCLSSPSQLCTHTTGIWPSRFRRPRILWPATLPQSEARIWLNPPNKENTLVAQYTINGPQFEHVHLPLHSCMEHASTTISSPTAHQPTTNCPPGAAVSARCPAAHATLQCQCCLAPQHPGVPRLLCEMGRLGLVSLRCDGA